MGPPLLVNLLSLRRSRSGGAETYATELVPRLIAGWPGKTSVLVREATAEWLVSVGWDPDTLLPVRALGSGSISVVATAWAARRIVRGMDAVVFSPFGTHTSGADRARELVCVHDLLPHQYVTGTWGRLPLSQRVVLRARTRAFKDATRRSGAIMVHAEVVRRGLLELVPQADPAKVHLVFLGADRGSSLANGTAPEAGPPAERTHPRVEPPFVLLVGSSTWAHKNLSLAIDMVGEPAFAAAGAPLVIVGRDVPEVPAEVAGRVVSMRNVSDAELDALYANCSCLMFPSFSEGFGLPLVEAMRSGVPCVVSDIEVFRELAGDAARYFDPTSPAAAAAAVTDVLGDADEAERLREAGRERANGYTWDACAEGYLAALRGLA